MYVVKRKHVKTLQVMVIQTYSFKIIILFRDNKLQTEHLYFN